MGSKPNTGLDPKVWPGPDPAWDGIEEISWSEWMGDRELQDRYEPEGTRCECGRAIGSFLGYDEVTTADRWKFESIWILPDGRAVCEDCASDVAFPPTEVGR